MNVATLQQFLRSLVPPLQAAESGHRTGQDLERACRGLEPFRTLDVEAFARFLERCDEALRTGAVQPPTVPDLGPVQGPLERLGRALAETSPKEVWAGAQRDLADGLSQLAKSAGLTASVKLDAKWAERQAARARVEAHGRAIRELAARISEPAAFQREDVAADRHRLQHDIPAAEWKLLAGEFGVAASAKGAKVLEDILAKLTGHRPEKPKPARRPSAAAAPDSAKVAELAGGLKALLERSKDVTQVTEAEIEAELNRLEPLKATELAAVARAAGVDNPGRSKGEVLNKIRSRLTAARRAVEDVEV